MPEDETPISPDPPDAPGPPQAWQPPPPAEIPPPGDPELTAPGTAVAVPPPAGSGAAARVRAAWQQRYETDYVFDFWTAIGWTLLSCGVYGYYVFFQLVRRSRDHNRRRLEMLDAATAFAWETAVARGLDQELRPGFERIAARAATLHRQSNDFRDPVVWLILSIVTGGIANYVAWVLLDIDLVDHDTAEGAIEADLAAIYTRLGAPVGAPDPARVKGRHNYVGRFIALFASCGIYGLFWLYDLMVEPNRHFDENWRYEDELAAAVQSLLPA